MKRAVLIAGVVLYVSAVVSVVAGISYAFALAGEPQSHWLWQKLGVLP